MRAFAAPLLLDRFGGVQDEQAGGVDLGAALGNPVLDRLHVTEHAALGELPRLRARDHDLERALADADPAHAVLNAPGTEPVRPEPTSPLMPVISPA